MKKVIVLSDCLQLNHSFWIRIGQYLDSETTQKEITITDSSAFIEKANFGDIIVIYRHQEEWGDITEAMKRAIQRGVEIYK